MEPAEGVLSQILTGVLGPSQLHEICPLGLTAALSPDCWPWKNTSCWCPGMGWGLGTLSLALPPSLRPTAATQGGLSRPFTP